MANPFPKNSRLERNPQPTQTPFNRPPLGAVPRPAAPLPRPAAPAANAAPLGALRGNQGNRPPAQQVPRGSLFDRRRPRVRRPHIDLPESVMHVAAGLVLIVIVALTFLGQSPPSQITAYAPRGGAVEQPAAEPEVAPAAQTAPASAQTIAQPAEQPAAQSAAAYVPRQFDWGPPGQSTGVTGWVIQRDLIRACPNAACVALSNPTILEAGLLTDVAAVDASRAWAMINATRPDGTLASGWVPLSMLRLNGDVGRLPVVTL
ncbi:MAG: hypothetical protein IPK19_38425 [Chloroflexi bacterium]|nr:hypothetical protein [Chloroflexota bacterium]